MQDRSGAGWSGETETDEEAVLGDRYEWRDVLGSGGMGTVHAVFDLWLNREVAMKLVRRRVTEHGSIRAIREAEITARLEHPAIVPVYDAGEAPDGRSFFTMRVARGRSLHEALAAQSQPSLEDRLPLLRVFVTICEAVAYAHSRGVIHRDLKPSNIMMGEFGEVQLVDWGLAHVIGEPDPFVGAVGTEGYASPEQARGEPPRPVDDVFALGVVLRAILDGTIAPEDLHAVADTACASAPSERYPAADALARDVQRYLDGRPVSAREYSSWALAARVVRIYRRGLATAVLALTVLGVVFFLAYRRVETARARAVEAERGTRAALVEKSDALAWALESSARTALDSGRIPEAEILAVSALAQRESPGARGVLMRVHAGTRPRSERVRVPTDCDRVFFGIDSHLCVRDGQASFWERGDEVARWRVSMAIEDAEIGRSQVILQGSRAAHLVERRTGSTIAVLDAPHRVTGVLVDPTGTTFATRFGPQLLIHDEEGARSFVPCHTPPTHAMALGEAHVAAACGDRLVIERLDTRDRQVLPIPFDTTGRRPVFALGFGREDAEIAIGGVGGELAVVDLTRETVSGPWPVSHRSIARVDFLQDGILASIDGGGAEWVSATSGVRHLSLPGLVSRRARAGIERIYSSHGNEQWTWTLPQEHRQYAITEPSGLSSAAFDPSLRRVFVARGDGRLSVRGLPDGEQIREVSFGDAVVKRCAVSSDGSVVHVAVADEPGGLELDTTTWLTRVQQPVALRRVVAFRDQVVWAAYGSAPRTNDAVTPLPLPEAIDLARSPDGRGAVGLGRGGELFRLTGDSTADSSTRPFAIAVALADDGRVAVAFRDRIVLIDEEREVEWSVPGEPLDLAFSHDGRLLGVGTREGAVLVYDASGDLRARADDAEDRVAWVEFMPDGRLATASWDGVLRFYETSVLDMTVEALEEDAHRTWRLSVEEVLGDTSVR